MMLVFTILTAAWALAEEDSLSSLLRTYESEHALSTEAILSDVCSRRYVSADFWGRGLGNSVNVPLNGLALAIATNRTLLVSDDTKFKAGFWKYLGVARWARKGPVMAAYRERCGREPDEKMLNFFPMNGKCLRERRCGDGVGWLLCGRFEADPPFIHVRAAVTWLAHLARARLRRREEETYSRRLDTLFESRRQNVWGSLYDMLLSPQPRTDDSQPLYRVLNAVLGQGDLFDVGVHVRHRREPDVDALEMNAARCVAHALESSPSPADGKTTTVFLATEQPSRLPSLMSKISAASQRDDLVFKYFNATSIDADERIRLRKMARTDVKAVREDWGPLGTERWLSVVDFYLLASSRVLVGALSSTFSELASASVHRDTVAYLYDPISHLQGPARVSKRWPGDDEYLSPPSRFRQKCQRSDLDWPDPQYVRLKFQDASRWIRTGNCDVIN